MPIRRAWHGRGEWACKAVLEIASSGVDVEKVIGLFCFGMFDAAGWSHESDDDLTRPERPSIA
jgi:hypothetical protein